MTSSGASRPSTPTTRAASQTTPCGDGVCTVFVACRLHQETLRTTGNCQEPLIGPECWLLRTDGEDHGNKRCTLRLAPAATPTRLRRTMRRTLFDDNADHLKGNPTSCSTRWQTSDVRQDTQQRRQCQGHVGFGVVDRCVVKPLPDAEDRRCCAALDIRRPR